MNDPERTPAEPAATRPRRPRLGIIGPLVGRHAGHVTTQGEILGDFLEADGYCLVRASSRLNRYARLLDILWTVLSRRKDLDVLLIQTYGGPSFVVEDAASLLARWLGIRVVFHLRGGAMPDFLSRHVRWGRRVLSRGDVLVVPSDYLARMLRRHGFEPRVIPNVVDVASYPFRLRGRLRPRLLWMRTFHAIYHPEMAVRVLARVRAVVPEARLVMGGEEKGLGDSTRRFAAELGVADAIRFAGFLDPAAKRREGSEAEVFLNTNRIDNQPVSVIEACAMGLPVVATLVGGMPDLLTDGKTALLVPDGDDEAMAESVLRLLGNQVLAARLSENARRLAEQFSPEAVLAAWRTLLDGLAAPDSGGG